MGLTFQQKFYQVPSEVYFVESEATKSIFAIIEKPDDEEEDEKLNMVFKMHGYLLNTCDFDALITEGFKISRSLGIK